jgi:pimeloyl-ACP methyl ester carboxylesterase
LLLIHGAGGSHLSWPPHLRRLPDRRVIALDLPGHGRSGGPGCTSIATYRDGLRDFVDALGLSRFVLAGHSMGGAIALDYARLFPERVAGLGLIGTSARLRVAPAILGGIRTDFAATTEQMMAWMVGTDFPASARRLAIKRLQESDPIVLHGDFVACDAFDLRAEVQGLTIPALIIVGEADQMTPPKFSDSLHASLPNSELHRIPKAGHMVQLEAPDVVTDLLAHFVEQRTNRPRI